MEYVTVVFVVIGIVAVLARFGPSAGPAPLPGIVDRSIGMYVIRRLRSRLGRNDQPDADVAEAATAEAATAEAPTADAPTADAPTADAPRAIEHAPLASPLRPDPAERGSARRAFPATPARLAAAGVQRAEPIRRPVARRPISIAPRSMAATRLVPIPPRSIWRHLVRSLFRP